MTDAPDGRPDSRLVRLVEIWYAACSEFVALAREIPREQWDLPTDLEGWTVKDIVAHTAHLEAVLAGAPEETVEVDEAPHLKGLMNYYTEQGVLARRDRDMQSLVDELEQAVATRHAALLADPPTDGSAKPAKTPGDIGWDTRTLLGNRPGRRVDARAGHPACDRAPGRLRRPRRCARAEDLRPGAADGGRQARRAPDRAPRSPSRCPMPAWPGRSASARTVGACQWTTPRPPQRRSG